MRLVNKLLYCLAAGIPAVALAACSSGGSGGVASGPPPEQSSIVIDAVPTADAAGLYIAQDNGYFAQQGLKVTIAPIHGGEYGIGDLQTGKAQLIEGNYVSFILAQIAGTFAAPNPSNPALPPEPARPINMRLIADSSQMQPGNQGLYVLPSSPYRTVQDLVRHNVKVGVNSLHNIGAVFLGALLASNNYKVDALEESPQVLPLMPQLLAKHVISAAWLPEPFATLAQQQYGAVQVADFDQGSLQNFPIGTIGGSSAWVQSHPNTVAAFLRAYNEGQQVADTNRSQVEAALVKNGVVPPAGSGITPAEVAATMTLDTYPLVMDVPVMQRVADAMYEFGVIGKPYSISKMIQQEPGIING